MLEKFVFVCALYRGKRFVYYLFLNYVADAMDKAKESCRKQCGDSESSGRNFFFLNYFFSSSRRQGSYLCADEESTAP